MMKKYNYKSVAIIVIAVCSVLSMSFFQTTNQIPDITGTWILDSDPKYKITYTNNGIRKDFYDNELVDTYTYTITKSCGGNTATIDSDYYIKNIDQEDELDISCDFINGIGLNNNGNGDVILSITSETGKLFVFTKQ